MTTLPNGAVSVIVPQDTFVPFHLPSPADIAGSPPPPLPHVRLFSAAAIKSAANPLMTLFSAPKDRLTSV